MSEVEQKQEEQGQEEQFKQVGYTEEELNKPVFEGGPTRRIVEEWKVVYKDIYFVPFEDEVYIFHKLGRPEYSKLIARKDLNTIQREEEITAQTLLFPKMTLEEVQRMDAGKPSIISEMVMSKSGFNPNSAPIKL